MRCLERQDKHLIIMRKCVEKHRDLFRWYMVVICILEVIANLWLTIMAYNYDVSSGGAYLVFAFVSAICVVSLMFTDCHAGGKQDSL